jgi:hypothetical protein
MENVHRLYELNLLPEELMTRRTRVETNGCGSGRSTTDEKVRGTDQRDSYHLPRPGSRRKLRLAAAAAAAAGRRKCRDGGG